MKPVPRKPKDDEDSITEIKKQNENPIIKKDKDDVALIENKEEAVVTKENGYLVVMKNVPFLAIMLANLPAVMGLYIPYMFLPGVRFSVEKATLQSPMSVHPSVSLQKPLHSSSFIHHPSSLISPLLSLSAWFFFVNLF